MTRAAYYVEYRRRRKEAGNPVHAERIRNRARRDLPAATFVDALMILMLAEREALGSRRKVSERLGFPDALFDRWMQGIHRPGADQIDAMVDYFGVRRVLSTLAEARRIIRTDPETDEGTVSSRLTTPGPFLPREINREPRRHPWG